MTVSLKKYTSVTARGWIGLRQMSKCEIRLTFQRQLCSPRKRGSSHHFPYFSSTSRSLHLHVISFAEARTGRLPGRLAAPTATRVWNWPGARCLGLCPGSKATARRVKKCRRASCWHDVASRRCEVTRPAGGRVATTVNGARHCVM